jgi:tetratricopeptide (TPR) repeat protein
MPHPQACPGDSVLWDFLQDQLAGADAERIDDHIGGCPACQRALDRLVGSLPGRWLPAPDGAEGDAPVTHNAPTSLGVMPQVLTTALEPEETAGPVTGPSPPGMPPATNGPARLHLLGEIARGGMGAVLKGRDVALGRDLAVKVLLERHRDESRLIRRFVLEARIAGQLQHPGTVPVHELGALPDGRPYFAMKLVKGRTLEALLKERTDPSEDLPRFLGIFEQVCQTVAYAHARGIIHRDLKPANVMVGRFGEVQVMDWGLARALTGADVTRAEEETGDGPLDEARHEVGDHTDPGSVLGTWPYMPPEQARGLVAELDRRSDVFGLGAVLCEILTGQPPYVASDAGSAWRLASEARLDGASARLRGCGADSELIALAQRCLAPNRADRPADGGEVASAVAGYLSGVQERLQQERLARERQEVQAAEGRRRHRVLAAAAASVLLALALGVVASTIFALGERAARQKAAQQAARATRSEQAARKAAASEKAARETAEAREAETQAVLGFVQEQVFAAARPKGVAGGLGPEITLRRALEASRAHVERSFADRPLIEARLRRTLGDSFWYLGEARIATEEHERARAIYAKLAGPDDPDTLRSMNALASSYRALGRYPEAVGLYEETLARRKATLGPRHRDTLQSMQNLATIYADVGRHAEALRLREDVLALQRTVLGPNHPETISSMMNLSNSYAAVGRHEEALKIDEETLALAKAAQGDLDLGTLAISNNLALSYSEAGRFEDAVRLQEETVAAYKVKFGAGHPATLVGMHNLAKGYADLKQYARAVKLCDEVLALQRINPGPDHPDTLHTLYSLANHLGSLGRYAEALRLHREALALRTARLGADHEDTLFSMWGVAENLIKLGHDAEAIPVIDGCLERAARTADSDPFSGLADLRLRHFVKARDAAGCRATAALWEKMPLKSPGSLYHAACHRAVTAAILRATDNSAEGAKQAGAEEDRAMAWLKKAVAAGFKDAAGLKQDKDLEALRDRADFRKLVSDLEAAPG